MRFLIPILMAVIGVVAGGGAGYYLRPAPEPEAAAECAEAECPAPEGAKKDAAVPPDAPPEYVKLNNQFIIPDIQNGVVTSLIVLSVSVEVTPGSTEKVFAVEPKLRDNLLQAMFDHANIGGFRGDFTAGDKMDMLRRTLLSATRNLLGDDAKGVLISDIVRQDMD